MFRLTKEFYKNIKKFSKILLKFDVRLPLKNLNIQTRTSFPNLLNSLAFYKRIY